MLPNAVQMMITIYTIEAAHDYSEHQNLFAKLQLNSQLDLHFKSIQLLQELSWSYALYLVFTTTSP